MNAILYSTGLVRLSQADLAMLFALVFFATVFLGWACDIIMGRAGFGVILNTLLLLIFMGAGIALYTTYIQQIRLEKPMITGLVALGSAMAGLFVCAILKRAIIRD